MPDAFFTFDIATDKIQMKKQIEMNRKEKKKYNNLVA